MGRSAKRDSTADRDDERPQLTLDLSAFSEPVSWRAHSKPPNYPTRRSEAAAAATSSSNYNTFTPSDAPRFGLGLSMAGARRKLLATIERKIEEKERSTNFTKEFRDPFSLLLVLCAVFRFLDYSRSTNDCDYELFEGFFLLTAAILNGLLNATQRRRHHDEIAERVRVAITAMAARKVEQVPMYWNPLLSRSGDSSKSAALLPSTSYVACYRDNQWHRLPMNLLVEGDVIALMSGDVAPGEVRLVDIEADHDRAEIHKACIFPRGFKIPSTGSTGESTRCNATFNPLLLLSLCGQMRLFEMMETPVLRDIEDSFFRINRPDTFTQKLQAKARLVAIYVCTMYSVFVLVAIGLRVVFQHRSLYTALNHLLLGPIGIWLCFASLNTPFVLFLAEAIATASILGSFEAILRPKTQHGNDSMDCDSPTKSKLEPEHEESDFRSTQPVSTAEDIYDFEEREKIRSEHASKQSALLRTWRYLLVTLKFRSRPSARVQPKRTIPDFIEDLTASGIRFVYFSPRNMRRSKLLAEKMGIETDWNCAISLRPLDSDRPDPHRMTSNYSDWDVKARLPHGVDAIKRHLEEVDNVPLLVSLYTDSTPETISEMISIFQENNEVVLGVGSSLKESNAMLFSKADLSVALEGSLRTYFDDALPNGSGLPVFSQEDVELSHILNTLACSFRIKSQVADDDHPSLTNMIELIRLGRSVLTNFHQMCSFIFVSQLFLATVILSAYIVPFPLVPQLSCASIFWLLWVLVPALSLSMLGSPAEKDVMKRTPRKNEDLELNEDLPRLTIYFLLRHVPSALVSIVAFECLMGFSLEDSTDRLDTAYQGFRWVDFVLHSSLVLEHPRPPVVAAAIDRAEAGMILVLALSILASSCGYLYRCESILQASPTRNRAWVCTVTALLCAQLVMCIVRAGVTGADGKTLWHFIYDIVPWYFWVGVFVWPIIVVVVDEMVKAHDRRHLTRYYKFLRMQFDTRLGMWSPK
ncbi:TPA: hypothetical protein N0F65_008705 [Lagenidium giganteum]|uniref:Cation-transporting P-type ATPase C-terminal domain-containing protein n=1 Tax=Lagenidium giganteum TaxID=4803 RepID=A0AAV2YRR9_9STRA|nr:TPA: hypothetical protein N0F65_008705 [Lagenidium giganteum]